MKRRAAIVDLDGTIADVSHLWHLAYGPQTDYDEFHRRAIDADPIESVLCAIDDIVYRYNTDVIIVTARQEKYRDITTRWLTDIAELKFDEMWMRKDGDDRSDYEIKKEILAALEKTHIIEHAFDDNPATVKLWLENDILTTVVPGWPADERWSSEQYLEAV